MVKKKTSKGKAKDKKKDEEIDWKVCGVMVG